MKIAGKEGTTLQSARLKDMKQIHGWLLREPVFSNELGTTDFFIADNFRNQFWRENCDTREFI
jgi:hypothetical protein